MTGKQEPQWTDFNLNSPWLCKPALCGHALLGGLNAPLSLEIVVRHVEYAKSVRLTMVDEIRG